METAYIRFAAPQSITKLRDENLLKRSIKKLLGRVIPIANPDFENELENVKYWLVECDRISGIPQREIGLDATDITKGSFEQHWLHR
jgi:hypothetical protein